MALPVMYSKLTMSSGSKGSSWLTLTTNRRLADKQVLADLKAAIQARLDLTEDNEANLSLG
jgi:hypothetical protein